MKKLVVLTTMLAVAGTASAAINVIQGLDIRGTGIFGTGVDTATDFYAHAANVSSVSYNGGVGAANITSNQIDVAFTYNNLNLDGDASANDSVDVVLRFSGPANQRTWGQGVDTGWGSVNGVTLSLVSVSGNTTDGGNAISFDGFVGGAVGVGGSAHDRQVDVNGNPISIVGSYGGFTYVTDSVDFAPAATILYQSTGGTAGSPSARNHDLQFSAIPEPATLGLISLSGLAIFIRRRFMV